MILVRSCENVEKYWNLCEVLIFQFSEMSSSQVSSFREI